MIVREQTQGIIGPEEEPCVHCDQPAVFWTGLFDEEGMCVGVVGICSDCVIDS